MIQKVQIVKTNVNQVYEIWVNGKKSAYVQKDKRRWIVQQELAGETLLTAKTRKEAVNNYVQNL